MAVQEVADVDENVGLDKVDYTKEQTPGGAIMVWGVYIREDKNRLELQAAPKARRSERNAVDRWRLLRNRSGSQLNHSPKLWQVQMATGAVLGGIG